jgi:hypothetical protein
MPEAYIVYSLKPNEEYVVGVNPWIMYDNYAAALTVARDMAYRTSLANSYPLCRSINIGEHYMRYHIYNGDRIYVARIA